MHDNDFFVFIVNEKVNFVANFVISFHIDTYATSLFF